MNQSTSGRICGIALIFAFSLAAYALSGLEIVQRLRFSPLIMGIIIGMIFANSLRALMPPHWAEGFRICTRQILRTGIVLFGFRLTLSDVALAGLPALLCDLFIVVTTVLIGVLLGKMLKMDFETSLLTASGSAVCGAAAVLGTESVLKCDSYKTAVAVSTVVIFGTISMFLYPFLYRAGVLDSLGSLGTAVYTGATLHEVAHVAGAGNAMDPDGSAGIAGIATITKMIRVILLAPLLVAIGLFLKHRPRDPAAHSKHKFAMPWFAFGFMGIIAVNSLLQMLTGAPSVKEIPGNELIEIIDTFLLTMAMTALGADAAFAVLKKAGSRPFALAGLLYLWLVFGGYAITLAAVRLC